MTQECQKGVIGAEAIFPALADEVRASGMVERLGQLAAGARAAGVAVVHCLAIRRPDGRGSNTNARLYVAGQRSPVVLAPGSTAAEVVDEIGVGPDDLVLERLHGVGPMHSTELDPVLRNLGVTTIVAVGVSVNVGLMDLVLDACNAGYQVVLPRDAVAGVPASYAEAVLEHTLGLLATVTTTEELLDAWRGPGSGTDT